jgi:hypothetical protein
MNNKDQYKLFRSLSQISNKANYDLDVSKAGQNSSNPKTDLKLETLKDQSTKKLPSIWNFNPDMDVDFEKCREISNLSNWGELSFFNGTKNYSKRNSLLSNLSALFHRDDNKD